MTDPDALIDAPRHEFEPYREGSRWCGFKWDGMRCGYTQAEHLTAWLRWHQQDRAEAR